MPVLPCLGVRSLNRVCGEGMKVSEMASRKASGISVKGSTKTLWKGSRLRS